VTTESATTEHGEHEPSAADRLRVTLLSFDFGQYCIRLANGLAELADVQLILPRQLSAAHATRLQPAVELHQVDLPRLRQGVRQLRMVGGVVRRIDCFRPDIVHYQAGHLWFNFGLRRLRRYPLVITIHESRHHLGDRASKRTPQWVMDLGYRRADRAIVAGTQLREAAVADLGLARESIDIVPTLPDVLTPDRVVTPKQTRSQTVLFFGRIWEYKGLEYLLRAQPLITRRVPQARIIVAGRGEDMDRYRRMIVDPDSVVIEEGYISDERMQTLFTEAALVALPYVDGSVSGVVAAACVYGTPAVVTHVGILPEMVDDGVSGLVVPARDEVALADAVVRLLTDEELRHRMAENALRKGVEVFSERNVAPLTISVYRRALSQRVSRH
jgi:glycosyltransferase involved in cell wall biosynthesis